VGCLLIKVGLVPLEELPVCIDCICIYVELSIEEGSMVLARHKHVIDNNSQP
jgi:hypothetical protein